MSLFSPYSASDGLFPNTSSISTTPKLYTSLFSFTLFVYPYSTRILAGNAAIQFNNVNMPYRAQCLDFRLELFRFRRTFPKNGGGCRRVPPAINVGVPYMFHRQFRAVPDHDSVHIPGPAFSDQIVCFDSVENFVFSEA
nr:hypothetical protein Iba_chr14cCG11640 [Ipomoea batatas]